MDRKQTIIDYSKRLWAARDLTAIDDYFAENARIISPLNTKKGSFTMREIAEKWLAAFPDLVITWQDHMADGNKVVSRWKATGTHMGSFFETSPTHREVSYTGVTVYTFDEHDKICEYWALVDMHAILTQLIDYDSISEVVD